LEWIMPMKRRTATLRIDPEQLKALEHISKTEGLTVHRKQNPGFKRAIDEFVEAEAVFEDPLEGQLIEEQSGERHSARPVQRKTRDILDS